MLLEAASIEGAQVWAERFRQDTAATAVVCGEVSISYSASMGGALLDPRQGRGACRRDTGPRGDLLAAARAR